MHNHSLNEISQEILNVIEPELYKYNNNGDTIRTIINIESWKSPGKRVFAKIAHSAQGTGDFAHFYTFYVTQY